MNLNNIYIIGFMASGKSSLGKKIAKQLDREFIDLDNLIEKNEKQTINEIFSSKGESYFRELETKALKSISNSGNIVSLGGGTPCFNGNIDFVKRTGVVIYFELPLKIIIGRLKQDKENRPLVKDLDDLELVSVVSKLFNNREKFYKRADLIIDSRLSMPKIKNIINDFLLQ